MLGVEINDRHQVEKASLQRDGSDVCHRHLVDGVDHLEIQQAGEALGRIAGNRGPWLLVDRP